MLLTVFDRTHRKIVLCRQLFYFSLEILLKKTIVISGPSGSGKTTIVKRVAGRFDVLASAVSATTRKKRPDETHGREYYFLSREDFLKKMKCGDFVEWEEVYEGYFYGTLSSELDRIWDIGKIPLFEIDVAGGKTLKQQFGKNLLSIFIIPGDQADLQKTLKERIENRKSGEDKKDLTKRLEKAQWEVSEGLTHYDYVISNYNRALDEAVMEVETTILDFLAT